MVSDELLHLIMNYGAKGLKEWTNAHPDIRRHATGLLGTAAIVDQTWEIQAAVKGGKAKFIPMPKHPSKDRGFEWSFFAPRADELALSYELFLLIDANRCLCFRIEPAQEGTHDYGHVQLNRTALFNGIPGDPLKWMPDSYPAFPTRTKDEIELFLYLATTVHGNTSGVTLLLRDLFRETRMTYKKLDEYLATLKRMLV